MKIRYDLIVFIYVPVLLLLVINTLRDRFELKNEILKSCNWSLLPAIGLILFAISWQVIIALWRMNLFGTKSIFPFDHTNTQLFKLFYYCLSLVLVYLVLRYTYKVHITKVFNLKSNHFPLILKVCSILAALHILDALVVRNRPGPVAISDLKLLDTQSLILFLFVAIFVAPIAEEIIFRGLLYSPLYRKTGRYPAIMLSALIWTYGHSLEIYPHITIFAFGIFVIGILLAWLYDRSGSLFPSIIVHMFQNSWIIVYLFSK